MHFPNANHCHSLASLMTLSLACLAARKVVNRNGLGADGKEVTITLVCQTFTEQTCSSSKETQRKHVLSLSEPSKRNQLALNQVQWEYTFKKTLYSELLECWDVLRCSYGFLGRNKRKVSK